MSSKILLAKVSVLVKLTVVGVETYTMQVSECDKGREGINNYEQIMESTALSNPPAVVFLSNSASHNLQTGSLQSLSSLGIIKCWVGGMGGKERIRDHLRKMSLER